LIEFTLEKLLLIVLASVVVVSVILYIYYSNSERKITLSHYWKASKSKLLIEKNVREKFQKHDQKIKAFKHLLEIVITSRNNVQKGLNEIKILVQDISKNLQVSADDLSILKKIGTEIHSLIDNLIQIKAEVRNTLTKDFTKMTDALIAILKQYEDCIHNILYAPQSKLENLEFISHDIQIMEKNYNDIVELHSQLIKEFQKSISEMDD
jgi:hypothetical protein